jgi:thioredoxin-related protein
MKKLSLVLLSFLIALSSFAVSFEDFVFFNDFDTGFEVAKILDKNVLLIFTSNSCPYCTQLKQDVIASEEVMNFLINNYILIELHANNDQKGHFDVENAKFDINGKAFTYQELFYLFDVRGVPATYFFNKDLEFLGGFPGYLPADDYLNWLKYVETESYKEGDINTFEIEPSYNGNLQIKALKEKDLNKIETYLPDLLTYFSFDKFREMNLISIDPFKYYIIRGAAVPDVEKYLNGIDKKLLYNVYVLE